MTRGRTGRRYERVCRYVIAERSSASAASTSPWMSAESSAGKKVIGLRTAGHVRALAPPRVASRPSTRASLRSRARLRVSGDVSACGGSSLRMDGWESSPGIFLRNKLGGEAETVEPAKHLVGRTSASVAKCEPPIS